MADLAQWLTAQLDEDKRIAQAAADYDDGAAHDVEGPPGTWSCLDEAQWFGPSYRGGVIAPRIGQVNAPELGAHIAEHDPARVLREIDAKRRIVEQHRPVGYGGVCLSLCHTRAPGQPQTWPCPTLRLLASVYDGRPGYQEAWRP